MRTQTHTHPKNEESPIESMFYWGFLGKKNGGKGGDRTHDTRIFSPRLVL